MTDPAIVETAYPFHSDDMDRTKDLLAGYLVLTSAFYKTKTDYDSDNWRQNVEDMDETKRLLLELRSQIADQMTAGEMLLAHDISSILYQ